MKTAPPYPDPARVRNLKKLINRYGKDLIFVMLHEGITTTELIDYMTRLCALKHLDGILAEPSPKKLVDEVVDLSRYKRMCIHRKEYEDRKKYGEDDPKYFRYEYSKNYQFD